MFWWGKGVKMRAGVELIRQLGLQFLVVGFWWVVFMEGRL